MRKRKISEIIGNINQKYVDEAAAYTGIEKHDRPYARKKWSGLAASFALLMLAGAAILPAVLKGSEADSAKYKYYISGAERDMEWPWEYKTDSEKYQTIEFNGNAYSIKNLNSIDTELLGDALGTCKAEGIDPYTGKEYTETFEVRKINGVSEERLVAAGNDNGFYVYRLNEETTPATFGEMIELYGLTQNLQFNHYTVCEGYDEKGYFTVNDDAYIWQILSECRDARLYSETDVFDGSNRNYLTFTATSDALGVYKGAVYISEDGYFATNIFDYSYIYFIGEEAAGKIINYVKNNSAKAAFEPYELTIAGTLTEIGDGYVLVDDRVLCTNEEDGTVYKIYTGDIRMRRCIECTDIKVGDTVAVKYRGNISDGNEIGNAYSMYKGTLVDGGLAIPE